MPSFPHEGYVDLFRRRPTLAPDLLVKVLGIELPEYTEVETTEADFSQLVPTEFRADLVLLLKNGKPVFGIIVEVQLGRDDRKPFSWPVYAAVLRARHQIPVAVFVFCPTLAVARWAAQTVELGPGLPWAPCVIGPNGIPVVESSDEGRAAPEMAVLSAVAHGDRPDGHRVLKAAMSGLVEVDEELRAVYFDLMMAALGEAAQRELQAMARSGNYEFASDFAKKYVAQGEAQGLVRGRAEGEAEGRAASLLQVLELRGFTVDEPLRERVTHATIEQLEAWVARAVTAQALADVFRDD